jgi:hypothetical protein
MDGNFKLDDWCPFGSSDSLRLCQELITSKQQSCYRFCHLFKNTASTTIVFDTRSVKLVRIGFFMCIRSETSIAIPLISASAIRRLCVISSVKALWRLKIVP